MTLELVCCTTFLVPAEERHEPRARPDHVHKKKSHGLLVETNFNPTEVIRVAERALSSGGAPVDDRPVQVGTDAAPDGYTAPAAPAAPGQFHFRLPRF